MRLWAKNYPNDFTPASRKAVLDVLAKESGGNRQQPYHEWVPSRRIGRLRLTMIPAVRESMRGGPQAGLRQCQPSTADDVQCLAALSSLALSSCRVPDARLKLQLRP